nr:MAG TPA: hypothetical protein [Bacteriophage sp.]
MGNNDVLWENLLTCFGVSCMLYIAVYWLRLPLYG